MIAQPHSNSPEPFSSPSANLVTIEDGRKRYRPPPPEEPGPPPPPPPTKPPPGKKHRAKRFNEQLKALYGYMNALAAAVIVTGFITPTVRHETLEWGWDTAALFAISLALHCVGQAVLFFFTRPEE